MHREMTTLYCFRKTRRLFLTPRSGLRFDQQHITRPAGKEFICPHFLPPVITLNYRKGINSVFGSDVNYDFCIPAIFAKQYPGRLIRSFSRLWLRQAAF